MNDFDAEKVVEGMRALSEVFKNLGNTLTTITESLHALSEAYFSQFEGTEEDFEDEDSDIPEPTNAYVLRSELIEHFKNYCPNWGVIDKDTVLDDIRNFPAADVKPVRHGRWIDKSDDEYAYCENVYQCSVCGEEWDILEGTPKQNSYHYCPNCGAKMDAEPPKEADA